MKILRYALDYSLTAVVSEFCSYNLLVCQPEVLSFIRDFSMSIVKPDVDSISKVTP